MKNRYVKKPWEKKKPHKDSVRIKGRVVLSFSRGRNGYGARKDGQRIKLERLRW